MLRQITRHALTLFVVLTIFQLLFLGANCNVTIDPVGEGEAEAEAEGEGEGEGEPEENVIINEFLASNSDGLQDEDEDYSDWIEFYNRGEDAVSLEGWTLTDDPDTPDKWVFPNVSIASGEYLVVFASGKDRSPTDGGNLHTNFKLSRDGEYLALYNDLGSPQVSSVFDPAYPQMERDISYGRDDSEGFDFYESPSPGQPNGEGLSGWVSELRFSREGGTFVAPFSLELNVDSPTAEIRYTLDGSEPTETMGEVYSVPLFISDTTRIRAKVFEPNTLLRPVESRVYIALSEDVASFDSNLPIVVVDSLGHDFSLDNDARGDYQDTPVYSVLIDTEEGGRSSITGVTDFAGHAGMHVRGASSATLPKKNFKFETWGEDDNDKSFPLLGLPSESDWNLHGPYFDKTFLRNYLVYKWWGELGYYSPRCRFVELFVHSGDDKVSMDDYEGLYVLVETIKRDGDRVDIASLDEDDIAEPEITGGYIVQATNVEEHFNLATGIRMKYVYPKQSDIIPEQAAWLQGYLNEFESVLFSEDFDDPSTGYSAYIDVDSNLDYDVFREFTRNIDGASTYMSIDRGGKLIMGPLWDYDQCMGMTSLFPPKGEYPGENGWEIEGWNNAYMFANDNTHWLKWWARLEEDESYQQSWVDRWIELRNGLLNTQKLLSDIDDAAALLEEAQIRNYERWPVLGTSVWMTGNPRAPREAPGWDERDTYAKEVLWMRDWLEDRLEWIDDQVINPVVINEVLAHSHDEAPDWIELYNTSDQPVDIGGWYLSDNKTFLTKYEISVGTIIAAGGYAVFYQDRHFGAESTDSGVIVPFALSDLGETVFLTPATDGQIDGYRVKQVFGPSDTGVSLGRHIKIDGTYDFVALSENTPGEANSAPVE